MKRIVNFIVNHEKLVLLSSLIVLVIGVILASKLKVETNMESLLPEGNDIFQASYDIDEEFGGQDRMIIVVQTLNDGNALVTKSFMDDMKEKLEEKQLVKNIYYKLDTTFFEEYAYLYIPTENYEALDEELNDTNSSLSLFLKNMENPYYLNALYEDRKSELSDEGRSSLNLLYTKYMNQTINEDELSELFTLLIFNEILMDEELHMMSDEGYITSRIQDIYLMSIKPNIRLEDYVEEREVFFSEFDQLLIDLLNQEDYKNKVNAGLTGGQMVQDYEADKVAFNSFFSTATLTFICIILFMVISFRKLLLPLLSGFPLLLSTILTAGFAFIMYGKLSIFSLSFAVLLLGLGIDFAIHILARYQEERAKGSDVKQSLTITLENSGKSIIIGALTTATAFLMFVFAKFRAFTEMGIISVAGIIFSFNCDANYYASVNSVIR